MIPNLYDTDKVILVSFSMTRHKGIRAGFGLIQFMHLCYTTNNPVALYLNEAGKCW